MISPTWVSSRETIPCSAPDTEPCPSFSERPTWRIPSMTPLLGVVHLSYMITRYIDPINGDLLTRDRIVEPFEDAYDVVQIDLDVTGHCEKLAKGSVYRVPEICKDGESVATITTVYATTIGYGITARDLTDREVEDIEFSILEAARFSC
jgi:hypothetical protein